MNDSLKKIAKIIKNSNKIGLFTHINPDFDALGSSLSLFYALKLLKKDVHIFIKDNLSASQKLLIDENNIEKNCEVNDFDLLISTDTPSIERLGDFGDMFKNFPNTIVLDHHVNDNLKGKYNYIDQSMSSCSEISLAIINALKIKLTKNIASLLFMGLSADTNSFINSNTNSNSFISAYQLSLAQAEILKINEIQYRMKSLKEIELEKYLLNNFVLSNGIIYCLMPLKQLEKLDAIKSDCDFFSSKLISIQGANIAFSVIESSPNFYEISLRSKNGFNVRNVATALGGGGHIPAAGAKVNSESIEKVKDNIIEIIKSQEEKS